LPHFAALFNVNINEHGGKDVAISRQSMPGGTRSRGISFLGVFLFVDGWWRV
jgi:hypothetical protein